MLKIIDNGEFYEQEKPLSLKDLKSLVLILKKVCIRQYHHYAIIMHRLDLLYFLNIKAVN